MSTLSFPASHTKKPSGLALMSSLITGQLRPGKMWERPHYRLKFFARSLFFPRATFQIVKQLAAHPLCDEILHAQPTLPCKVQRPYLALT